jgi:hypothetical protein
MQLDKLICFLTYIREKHYAFLNFVFKQYFVGMLCYNRT